MVAAGGLWDRLLGPFLYRPLARALRRSIDRELVPMVDERITRHEARMLRQQGQLERRLTELAERVDKLDHRISDAEAAHAAEREAARRRGADVGRRASDYPLPPPPTNGAGAGDDSPANPPT